MNIRLFFPLLLWVTTTGCLRFQTKPSSWPEKPGSFFLSVPVSASPGSPALWRIHYRERGKPHQPVVLMIHGYGSSSIVWVPLMRILNKQGYRTIAIDLPGFGLSDKYPGDYRTTTLANVVATFLQAKQIRSADVVAHSWGSSVALSLALHHPRQVKRLVLHSAWIYTSQLVPVIRWSKIPGIGEMIYGLFYTERPGDKFALSVYDARRMVTQEVVDQIKASYRRPGAVATALAVARGMNLDAVEKRYARIYQQTLLLWGKQDHVALPFYAKRLVSEMPRAQLVFLDRCGHLPMLEQPFLVHRYVSSFLGSAHSRPQMRLP